MKRFIWYSDTHMDMSLLPFLKRLYILKPTREKADGIIITGDISSGPMLESDLRFLAKNFAGPVYFVLGNHDYYGRHIASVHADIKRICCDFKNLKWLTDSSIISLTKDVALIGTEGWYDARIGDIRPLKFSLDRMVTFDFLQLKSFDDVIATWRKMASDSALFIEKQLEIALQDHETVYIATHFPPWKEAMRNASKLTKPLWLSYNTNVTMGETIEKVMKGRKGKRVIVLAGHTHTPCYIRISDSIECMVARASFFGPSSAKPEESIIV